jgi:hypothetical protein
MKEGGKRPGWCKMFMVGVAKRLAYFARTPPTSRLSTGRESGVEWSGVQREKMTREKVPNVYSARTLRVKMR